MNAAGIKDGPHKCPKGLRHGYGVNAILKQVPLNMLHKMGGPRQDGNHGDLCQRRRRAAARYRRPYVALSLDEIVPTLMKGQAFAVAFY